MASKRASRLFNPPYLASFISFSTVCVITDRKISPVENLNWKRARDCHITRKPLRSRFDTFISLSNISHCEDKTPGEEKAREEDYHRFEDFDEDSQEYQHGNAHPHRIQHMKEIEKEKEKEQEQAKRKTRKLEFYAELVSDRGLPVELPPIKVIIHSAIAESAAVSIKDAHTVANELSKSLLLDLLHDPNSAHQFGRILDDVFRYEALREPTRKLLYWALTEQPDVHYATYQLSKFQLVEYFHYFLPSLLLWQTSAWLTSPATSSAFFVPLLADLSRDRESIIDPLTHIVKDSLPSTKEMAVDGLRALVKDTLAAEETKTLARDAIVSILRRTNSSTSTSSTSNPVTGQAEQEGKGGE